MRSELMRSWSAGTRSISTTPRQYARLPEACSICRSRSQSTWQSAVDLARKAGLQVLGADASGPATVDDLARSGELAQPTLWVMGNEAWGLPPEHVTLLDRLVALPIYGRAESLNLSTAAAVFLYASATAQRGPIARAIALTIPVFLATPDESRLGI